MIWFVCGVAVGAIAAAIVAGIHHFQYKVWIINKVFGENIPLVTPGDPKEFSARNRQYEAMWKVFFREDTR